MNKKNIIQTVVIVGCFVASAIVIYNNFFSGPKTIPPELLQQAVTTPKGDQAILPNGGNFDLSKVQNSKLRFNLLDYTKVNYTDEVGQPVEDILKPMVVQTLTP